MTIGHEPKSYHNVDIFYFRVAWIHTLLYSQQDLNIWLRLFCIALFWACPGQLLVYAICKEGYPENRGKKVALVSPAMEKEVCKKKVRFF